MVTLSDLKELHEVLWTAWSPQYSDADKAFPTARAPIVFVLRKMLLQFAGPEAAAKLTDGEVLDLWAWATFGSESLTLVPNELRSSRLRAISERYGIPQDSIVWMITQAGSWRNKP